MSTPKNQQQPKALSTSKKGSAKGLKNVLVQPNEILWPILRNENEKNELHSMLTELLPMKKQRDKGMSWAKLCRLSKEERLALKKDSELISSDEKNDNKMTAVILGVNSVTKALERNNVCSILVESNVEPLFLVKHIVVMGQNKNIPVLLIPFLKTVTLNKIGFASAALGIKNFVSEVETEHFHRLHKKISELVNAFPKVKAPLQLFNTIENKIDSQSNVEQKCSLEDRNIESIGDSTQKNWVSESVYKYRSSCKERAFIPPGSEPMEIEKKESSTEFIAFNVDSDTSEFNEVNEMFKNTGRYHDINQSNEKLSLESKNELNTVETEETIEKVEKNSIIRHPTVKNIEPTIYVPLKVKRIQGNPKRLKARKVTKLKKNKCTKK